NVVFSCGQIVADGTVYVYYGGADACIGVAAARIEDFTRKA
ncbi:MAG: glycosidase, partial [Firmicutes bacterium]|nr:glycosidase [Bacillota bacterium]